MNSNSALSAELPRYRATMDLHPPTFARMSSETPWTSTSDDSCWQYAPQGRLIAAGEEVVTDQWPHASMVGLNIAAREILEFFRTRQRSRMQLKPIRAGRVYLDDGLAFASEPNLPLKTGAAA